jgi:rhamnosyltransferase
MVLPNSTTTIACIVPVRNGIKTLPHLLSSLRNQSTLFDLFFVDSQSIDGSFEFLCSEDENVFQIDKSNFNHGGTRQLLIDRNPGYDFYIFLTQDAYLEDCDGFRKILDPFMDSRVAAVCGRQLPHHNASLLAIHNRLYNYPIESNIRCLSDVPSYGLKTAFMSNSFSAYRGEAIKLEGGFPKNLIFGEDMYLAAKFLLSGWCVAYESMAKVRHSHNYSLLEEFNRYFDIGVFHSKESKLLSNFSGTTAEGFAYVKSEIIFLGFRHFYLWPFSLLRNGIKLVAYKLGKLESIIPLRIKRLFSMNRNYWSKNK